MLCLNSVILHFIDVFVFIGDMLMYLVTMQYFIPNYTEPHHHHLALVLQFFASNGRVPVTAGNSRSFF